MKYTTISQVSRGFNVSTRTLRYYEELGLLKSARRENYAYRVYDEEAVARLRQILLLRCLRIPLRHIAELLQNRDTALAVEIFQENIAHLEREIHALETIRHATTVLCEQIQARAGTSLKPELLTEEDLLGISEFSSLSRSNRRGTLTMNDLTHANDALTRFENTRIIYVPPATVAAFQSGGPEPEDVAGAAINRFIVTENLFARKPDYRLFGFNNPSPTQESEAHGYEFWVTVPDDMEVPPPYEKKRMPGGLYAAHCIRMGNFEEWEPFWQWIQKNDVCAYEEREPHGMCGSLEEHLNPQTAYTGLTPETCEMAEFRQLDLLVPVRLKR